jgi:hypothetical protein
MEAIKAEENETAAKANIAKIKVVRCIDDPDI